ncbi:MAG: hypothetical protein OXU20_27390 [Myxococcales bacterium]|nr:hypothetical protein [Myxococcales bacterium]
MRMNLGLVCICAFAVVGALGCKLDRTPASNVGSAQFSLITVTESIGPEGGSIILPVELGAQPVVTVPPGALKETTDLTFTRESRLPGDGDIPALPKSFEHVGAMYSVKPHGLEFAMSVDMTIPNPGLPTGAIHLFTLDDDEDDAWDIVKTPKTITAESVTIPLDHFSYFQVARYVEGPGPDPLCGNGQYDPGEVCDDGTNDGAYGGCAENCLRMGPYCGDGIVQSEEGESCDGDCPTEDSCMPTAACIPVQLVGDPLNCDAACVPGDPIEECINEDGCCARGCNASNDSDCGFECRNMLLEPGEGCEDGTDNPCPTDCDDRLACTKDMMSGSAEDCNAACAYTSVTTPMDDDLCCPADANAQTDNDCSDTCGNGVIEPGELCEDGVGEGCPDSCDDDNACTMDLLTGNPEGCSSQCSYTLITMARDDDGCCPTGANERSDNDCPPQCGNQVQETGETCEPGPSGTCEPDCDDGDPCTADSRSGNPENCNVVCVHEAITQPSGRTRDRCCPPGGNADNDRDCPPVCGNGVVEAAGDETCEPGVGGGCPSVQQCQNRYPDPCQEGRRVEGITGNECTRWCDFTLITDPSGQRRDQCCPTGANANNDIDCSPTCGNGALEGSETCDDGPGSSKPCPTSCSDGNPCTENRPPTGTPAQCNVRCSFVPITDPNDGDMCCPKPTANANNDNDCSPECGNNVVEAGETCDGSCQSRNACLMMASGCRTAEYVGSPGNCNVDCRLGTITQPSGSRSDSCCPDGANVNMSTYDVDCPDFCGNGVKEGNEKCDGDCPSLAFCRNQVTDPCKEGYRTGNPNQCNAECAVRDKPPGEPGDGCCPPGFNNNTDSDCPASCNNGELEMGELCDDGPGSTNRCPTGADCRAMAGMCRAGMVSGTGCQRRCVFADITQPADGDMCCPRPAAHANNDSDCRPMCGNGEIESGESCDGDCQTKKACEDMGNACTDAEYSGGPDTCDADCKVTEKTAGPMDGCCPPGADAKMDPDCDGCGNGRIEDGETCEDDCVTQQQCMSMGDNCTIATYTGSPNECTAECTLTPKGPSGTTADRCCPEGADARDDVDCAGCGNGRKEEGEICDGADCPTEAECQSLVTDPCQEGYLEGDANSCNAECKVRNRDPDDSAGVCCPSVDNPNPNDPDCPRCGDGNMDEGELCDGNCPSNGSCQQMAGDCQTGRVTGADCQRRCVFTDITEPANGDMCCPDGAHANNDNDCMPVCDNGELEGNEKCDGNCPSNAACQRMAGTCQTGRVIGADCQRECAFTDITEPAHGDMCCPRPAANANNDDDCSPMCGNGEIEGNELCDGKCPTMQECLDTGGNCTIATYSGSPAECDASCTTRRRPPTGNDGFCCPGPNDPDPDCPVEQAE